MRHEEEHAYDSDAFQQQRRRERRNSNYGESPGPRQIRNSNEHAGMMGNSGRQSFNKQTNRSLQSNHGMACIINPEHVEP